MTGVVDMRVSPWTAAVKWRDEARLIGLQFGRHRRQVQTAASVTEALRSAPGRVRVPVNGRIGAVWPHP